MRTCTLASRVVAINGYKCLIMLGEKSAGAVVLRLSGKNVTRVAGRASKSPSTCTGWKVSHSENQDNEVNEYEFLWWKRTGKRVSYGAEEYDSGGGGYSGVAVRARGGAGV